MKKIRLKLDGLDGNAFALLGAFRQQARVEGWTATEIATLLDDATSRDYAYLCRTLADRCVDPETADDEEMEAIRRGFLETAMED